MVYREGKRRDLFGSGWPVARVRGVKAAEGIAVLRRLMIQRGNFRRL